MELTGEVRIHAARERVWHALNDARTLMACIPGCEEVDITSATERHVRLLVKAGPVRARFVGKITLSDVVAGSACVMNFEGSGGTAGMATGKSSVQLRDEGDTTVVQYTATASVGGKLGQIGARMLDAASKQMADQFFKRLGQELGDGQTPSSSSAAQPSQGAYATHSAGPSAAPAPQGHAATPAPTPLSEGTRLLWFACGCAATGFGVLLASLLR
jgi:carbon monoxide dehydrogenase subunit G